MQTFRDLKTSSINTIKPYIEALSLEDLDLDLNINEPLPLRSSGLLFVRAEYAITYAVLFDDQELAKDLCENGADLTIIDAGTTPMELAVEYGRAHIVQIFINFDAKSDNAVNVPSNNLCSNPFQFFWSLKESVLNREVDYQKIEAILNHNKSW